MHKVPFTPQWWDGMCCHFSLLANSSPPPPGTVKHRHRAASLQRHGASARTRFCSPTLSCWGLNCCCYRQRVAARGSERPDGAAPEGGLDGPAAPVTAAGAGAGRAAAAQAGGRLLLGLVAAGRLAAGAAGQGPPAAGRAQGWGRVPQAAAPTGAGPKAVSPEDKGL